MRKYHGFSHQVSSASSVQGIMLTVLLALIPGVIVMVLTLGTGVLINLLIALFLTGFLEMIFYAGRSQSSSALLQDPSGVILAVLFALALPPELPWWMVMIGISFAVIFGKQIYGGLGNNLFNPAMIGVAVLLVSFPAEMSQWSVTNSDATSAATPLDNMRTALSLMNRVSEIEAISMPWVWINLAFLAGGLILIWQKIIRWQIPVAMLSTLFFIALLAHMFDPEITPGAMFHLFSGATMLCAFFIATDPVTAPITARGRLVFGAAVGALLYALRTWGVYPDGVAFAVLMMNCLVPLIDRHLGGFSVGEIKQDI